MFDISSLLFILTLFRSSFDSEQGWISNHTEFEIIPFAIKTVSRNDDNWSLAVPILTIDCAQSSNNNNGTIVLDSPLVPTLTLDDAQIYINNGTTVFDPPQFIIHETIRTGTRLHGSRNESAQNLKGVYPADPMEMNMKGMLTGSLALLKKMFNYMRQDIHLQDELVHTARQESLMEIQMKLQLNANQTSNLISRYEAFAFPPDLCCTHEKPKMLPAFDDLTFVSNLEDAVAQRQHLLKQNRNLQNFFPSIKKDADDSENDPLIAAMRILHDYSLISRDHMSFQEKRMGLYDLFSSLSLIKSQGFEKMLSYEPHQYSELVTGVSDLTRVLHHVIDLINDFELVHVPRRCRPAIDFRQEIITKAETTVKAMQKRASELYLFEEMLLIINRITVMNEYFDNNFKSNVCLVNEISPFLTEFQYFDAMGFADDLDNLILRYLKESENLVQMEGLSLDLKQYIRKQEANIIRGRNVHDAAIVQSDFVYANRVLGNVKEGIICRTYEDWMTWIPVICWVAKFLIMLIYRIAKFLQDSFELLKLASCCCCQFANTIRRCALELKLTAMRRLSWIGNHLKRLIFYLFPELVDHTETPFLNIVLFCSMKIAILCACCLWILVLYVRRGVTWIANHWKPLISIVGAATIFYLWMSLTFDMFFITCFILLLLSFPVCNVTFVIYHNHFMDEDEDEPMPNHGGPNQQEYQGQGGPNYGHGNQAGQSFMEILANDLKKFDLPPDATVRDVESKWRKKSLLLHPDRNRNPNAGELFREYNNLQESIIRRINLL